MATIRSACLAIAIGLATLPIEPYESARIDGASTAQMFWRITLPLLRPAIIVALLFRAIDCLKTFDIIYVMTQGGPAHSTLSIVLYMYEEGFRWWSLGYAAALAFVLFAIILALTRVARWQGSDADSAAPPAGARGAA